MRDGLDIAFIPLRALAVPAFALTFGVDAVGRENVPQRGPAILAANHASFLDPILIATYAPRAVHFLVSNEFYRMRRLNLALRALGAIPVGGEAGMIRSFRRVAKVVKDGGLLGIFPEGGITRDGAMRPFRAGAATIALRLGVPVVPMHVGGTFAALPRHAKWPRFVPLTLRFGQAIGVAARPSPSTEEIGALTETLRSEIASLATPVGPR